MSLGMTLSELDNECSVRGLSVTGSGRNGKIQRMDYTRALEQWSMNGLRSQGLLLPGCEYLHMNLSSPMLAEPQKVFKTDKLFKEFISRDDVLAEEKKDGVRIMLSFHPGVGFELYSRNRSVVNFLFGSYVDQVYGWQRDVTENALPFSFMLDGELISLNPSVNGHVVTDTMLSAVVSVLGMNQTDSYRMQAEAGYPLRFQAFDIVMYDGSSVMNKPLSERKKILHEVVTKLHEAADRLALPQLKWVEEVKVIRGGYDAKYNYYKEITSAGGEGLILKPEDGIYKPHEARGGLGAGFIKWKRTTSESMGSDLDAFVTGCVPGSGEFEGLVGSLIFSVYLTPSGQLHEIARVSGISDDIRRDVTVTGLNGSVSLNPAWMGRVAAIEGMDVSSKSRTRSHARILKWRSGADSKAPAQCVMQEAVLNDMVL